MYDSALYLVHSMDTMDSLYACRHYGLFLRFSYTDEAAWFD
jgi:hypothetical protein